MKRPREKVSDLKLSKEKNKLMKVLISTRFWIKFLAGVLAFFFGWLKLKGVAIGPMTTDTFASFLLKASLVIYYFSWVFGASLDAKDQALVYLTAPNKEQLPKEGIGLMIAMAIVFGALCYVDTYRQFAAVLGFFWFINIIAWRYLVIKLLRKPITISYDIYSSYINYIELEKLKIVKQYIDGPWQWWRFVIGAFMIGGINFLLYTNLPARLVLYTDIVSIQFVPAFSIFLFVFSVELWIWIMRIKRRISLNALENLAENYVLRPKGTA